MGDFNLWKKAKSPNYETNKDKLYPYSEMPFQSEYKVVKIPLCVNNLIEHVDYFGFGRIELSTGTSGFPDCYNVNFEYQLVREGCSDVGRKIPNMIPLSRTNPSSRNYIKDNSVHTLTVSYFTMSESTVQDIARIVNSKRGKVILYGYNAEQIEMIADELKTAKQLFYCPIYLLPDNLRLTYWYISYRAYLGINELKRELYRNIKQGDLEAAVILTGCLTDTYCGGALGDVVNKLLENNVRNVIAYAYKLWNNNDKDVVRKHFPSVFQQIFGGDCMAIINEQNNQALVLEPKTTKARGDCYYKSSNKLGWKIVPILDDNKILFKLYNIDSDTYLQLSPAVGEDGVRQACGSKELAHSKELSDKFYFEPLIIMNGQVAFNIFNCEDDKQLEWQVEDDSSEVQAVVGYKSVSNRNGRSSWILTTSNQVKKKSVKKDEQAQSDDEDFTNIYNYD